MFKIQFTMRWIAYPALLAFAVGTASPVFALSFPEALALAKQHDPTFRSAQANLDTMLARSDIAFASLLPQVTASVSTSKNEREYTTYGALSRTTDERFDSDTAQVTLTQSLWQHSYLIGSKQADFSVTQARQQLSSAEQDLYIRFSQAWFDLMQARNTAVFNQRQVLATQYIWEQAQRSSSLGLMADPALQEAQGKYDQALADSAAATTDQHIKHATLESIIGPIADFAPPGLAAHYRYTAAKDETPENCVKQAYANNPSILAALMGLKAAGAEISKQRAGHEPTLDLVASYNQNKQGAGTTPSDAEYKYDQNIIELRLNVPIYSGGGQNAKVREAVSTKNKAHDDLEAAQRAASLTCKQAWYTRQASEASITAGLQTLKFMSSTYDSTLSAKAKGLKTDGDVLQADQQREGAFRDLQKARYESLMSTLKLKAAMGILDERELLSLDRYFENAAIVAEPASNKIVERPATVAEITPAALPVAVPLAIVAPAQTTAFPYSAQEQELLAMPGSHVVLQVANLSTEAAVKNLLVQLDAIDKTELRYYRRHKNNTPSYIVVYGNYSGKKQAANSQKTLPLALRKASPWPRSLHEIQDDLKHLR